MLNSHGNFKLTEPLLRETPNKPRLLRALLAANKTYAAPGAFNAISAKIIESVGFHIIYISGAGLNNGVAGYPDIGMLSQSEMANFAGYIARSVNVPAIADGDTGFGEAIQVYRTVQEYERQGIAAVHLEDQVLLKRCGHLSGKQVISKTAMAEKITAAVAARTNPDFMVIARVDSRGVYNLNDAIDRANAYLDAGADMIFPEALETIEEFKEFAKHVKAPLLANMTEFGKTPLLSVREFQAFGYNIVIFPMTAFRIMMHAVQEAMETLRETGTQRSLIPSMKTRQELYELIHYPEYEALSAHLHKASEAETAEAID